MTTRTTFFPPALYALVFFVGAACGASDDGPSGSQDETWREPAMEINDLTCQRIYECFSPELLGAVRAQLPQVGNSAEECQQNFRAENANATAPCQPGKSFHSDLADQCLVALGNTSCQDFMTALLTSGGPAPCPSVCS
jgi:hypothetical protein